MRHLGVKSGFPLYVAVLIGEGNVILQAGDAQNELVSLQGHVIELDVYWK